MLLLSMLGFCKVPEAKDGSASMVKFGPTGRKCPGRSNLVGDHYLWSHTDEHTGCDICTYESCTNFKDKKR